VPQTRTAPQQGGPNLRLRWAAAAAAGLAIAGVGTWLLWPESPRQREYLDVTACLLTDANGVTGEAARPVWAALQEASVDSRARVQYLAVAGPPTQANAEAHVASLAGSRCGLVVAVGPEQTEAVSATAMTFPRVRFVTVDSGASSDNVAVVSADTLRETIGQELTKLAESAD
jgi:basic membrane lipoprotein Med (substrate-binding protein (PBP1-ABC) superfamily)